MHLVGVHLTFTKFKMYMSDLTLTKILDVKQNLGNLQYLTSMFFFISLNAFLILFMMYDTGQILYNYKTIVFFSVYT